jgi:hypothetical protein
MMALSSEQRKRVVYLLLARFHEQQTMPATVANQEALWDLLCAAHIAGQHVFGLHMQTHRAMLRFA